jgi:restriction system protein
VLKNRLSWAKADLKKAELIFAPSRGYWKITDEGQKLLAEGLPEMTTKWLCSRYPVLQAWTKASRPLAEESENTTNSADSLSGLNDTSPLEQISELIRQLRQTLAEELLEERHKVYPTKYERIILDLMLAFGYGGSREDASQHLGQSNDGGVDGVISEDRLGMEQIYLQAKRYKNTVVGRPTVQEFVSPLAGKKYERVSSLPLRPSAKRPEVTLQTWSNGSSSLTVSVRQNS